MENTRQYPCTQCDVSHQSPAELDNHVKSMNIAGKQYQVDSSESSFRFLVYIKSVCDIKS